MRIDFATCEENKGIEWIRISYPNLSKEAEKTIRELLSEDIMRVRDPKMYNGLQIQIGENFHDNSEENGKRIQDAVNMIDKHNMKK